MDMQDKDFDKLFSSKFDDFEAEPSPMVWENIADELGGKKATRSWGTYLSIAAGIVVVFTAGWLLLQKGTQTQQKHHNYANLVRHDTVKPIAPAITAAVIRQSVQVLNNQTSKDKIASNKSHQHKTIILVNKTNAPVANKVNDAVKQSWPDDSQQVVAQAAAPVTTPVKPIMPDVQLTPKTIDVIAAAPVEKPIDIASTEKEPEEPVKKRGIHNLGGLINALVAKVDKRPNKFIEFSDGEDDDAETNITGVNMGPIKIKKQ